MKTFLRLLFGSLLISYSSMAQWTAVNNNLGSLKITGIAHIGTTLYAGTADQGIFTSADNGGTWAAYANNASLPSTLINGFEGDDITAQGISIYTQNGFSMLQGSQLITLPTANLTNKSVTIYRQYQNPSRRFLGTKSSGLFYTDDDVNWTEVTGIPTGSSKNIRGMMSQDANVLMLVGTENGAYKSTDRGNTWGDATTGLAGNAMKINGMYSIFALTSGGIYYTMLSSFVSWFPAYPQGDFRAGTSNFATNDYYFFGDNVGVSINLATSSIKPLTVSGIAGGAVTSATLLNNMLFVGTETGGVFRAQVSSLTDVNDSKDLPNDFSLSQNYPNPFNPSTTIKFSLPVSGSVTLKIFNLLGEEVAQLLHGEMTAGLHTVQFNAGLLPSGIYFYQLQSGNSIETKRMLLMK